MSTNKQEDEPMMIVIDWGTSSCRAWLLDFRGRVLDHLATEDGALQISGKARSNSPEDRADVFRAAFESLCGQWLDVNPGLPVVAAGMVGSNQGWKEAEYLPLPANVSGLASKLVEVEHQRGKIVIIPGLLNPGIEGGTPDVMRGEEVQILGALEKLPDQENSYLLLPGTHAKWVKACDGIVIDYATAMSGELYGLVMNDSIVGRLADTTESVSPNAFERGLQAADSLASERGLAAALFSGRTLAMSGQLRPADIGDYISGIVIGDEVRHMTHTFFADAEIVQVCGTGPLMVRYMQALSRHGIETRAIDSDVSILGIRRVAEAAGIVPVSEGAAV